MDLTNERQTDQLERKMMEAIERIENLRSKALVVGTILATGR